MTPYLIAAFLAAGSMAWYFFVFVPAQLEYFVGLRFRTLAVASGQIRSKIENLEKALDGAGAGVRKDHSAKKAAFSEKEREQVKSYLRLLVPEIQLDEGDHAPSGFALSAAGNPDLAATVAWESVVDQARAASLQDFEDLILASPEGKVVWQREKTTPRLGNLNELLSAESTQDGWLSSLSWRVRTTIPKVVDKQQMPETPVLKPVNLNGQSSFLLVQAIRPSSNQSARLFYVAGLISQKALQRQAMHIPTAWIVLLTLPVVLLFLGLPFVKLATLTSKERYRFADVILLAAATILAAGIGAMLPFAPSLVDAREDDRLGEFAKQIEMRLKLETERILDLAKND